ncbi:MAG: hypothetical protein ACW98A_09045 [Candidatus Hodarchaeales archaeon]|jgi:hypothetical protein
MSKSKKNLSLEDYKKELSSYIKPSLVAGEQVPRIEVEQNLDNFEFYKMDKEITHSLSSGVKKSDLSVIEKVPENNITSNQKLKPDLRRTTENESEEDRQELQVPLQTIRQEKPSRASQVKHIVSLSLRYLVFMTMILAPFLSASSILILYFSPLYHLMYAIIPAFFILSAYCSIKGPFYYFKVIKEQRRKRYNFPRLSKFLKLPDEIPIEAQKRLITPVNSEIENKANLSNRTAYKKFNLSTGILGKCVILILCAGLIFYFSGFTLDVADIIAPILIFLISIPIGMISLVLILKYKNKLNFKILTSTRHHFGLITSLLLMFIISSVFFFCDPFSLVLSAILTIVFTTVFSRGDKKLRSVTLISTFLIFTPLVFLTNSIVPINTPGFQFAEVPQSSRIESTNVDLSKLEYYNNFDGFGPLTINSKFLIKCEVSPSFGQVVGTRLRLVPIDVPYTEDYILKSYYDVGSKPLRGPLSNTPLYTEVSLDKLDLLPGYYKAFVYYDIQTGFSHRSPDPRTYDLTLIKDDLKINPTKLHENLVPSNLYGGIYTVENDDQNCWIVSFDGQVTNSLNQPVPVKELDLFLELDNKYEKIAELDTKLDGKFFFQYQINGSFPVNTLAKVEYAGDGRYNSLQHEEHAGFETKIEDHRFFIDRDGDWNPEWPYTLYDLVRAITDYYPDYLEFFAEFNTIDISTYDSISNYEGTLEGNTTWSDGVRDYALLFDGDGNIIGDMTEVLDSFMYAAYATISYEYMGGGGDFNGCKDASTSSNVDRDLGSLDDGIIRSPTSTTMIDRGGAIWADPNYANSQDNVYTSADLAVSAGGNPPVIEDWTEKFEPVASSSIVLDRPSGLQDKDLLLLIVMNDDRSGTAFSDNKPGWNFVDTSGGTGSDAHIAAFWKITDGVENPTETVTSAGSDEYIGYYLRISGAHQTAPINTKYFTDSGSSGSNTHIIPQVTTSTDNCLLLYGLSFDVDEGYTFSVSSGWTENDEALTDQNSGCFGSKILASQGPSGDATVTASASDTAAYFQLAIAPDSGDGSPESNYLHATGFDFSNIPDTAEIKGITVEIDKYASGTGSIEDYSVQLRNSTGSKGDDRADPTPWPSSDAYTTYGASDDLWGTSWTVSEIKDSAFGVDIVADLTGTSATAHVDHIQITVNYTETLSGREWISHGNAKTQNDAYTVASFTTTSEKTSDFLRLTDFGFNLDDTAQITGIEVGIDRQSDMLNSITDGSLKLLKGGVPIIGDKASTTLWTDSDTYVVYGAFDDPWGTSWDYTEINDVDFGVELFVNYTGSSGAEARIDHVNITVYYTEPPSLQQEVGIIRPDGDLTAQWNGTSIPHNGFLNETVIDPALPDPNSYIFTSSFSPLSNVIDQFSMSDIFINGGTVTEISIKVYGNETDTSIDSTVNIDCGGLQVAKQLDMGTDPNWHTYTWTVSKNQGDLDGMHSMETFLIQF